MEISQPVTELSNQITKDIDTSSIPDCLEMLCKCDREMFNGWSGFGGLYSDENMCSGLKLASHLRHCRKTGGRIILAGCGTSGRLAFIISKLINRMLKNAEASTFCADYCIAGGDESLFLSREAFEDDPIIGEQDLIQASGEAANVLYLGITCGLSAPYVAGQLQHCLQNPDRFIPVLIGFNPTRLARKFPIKNWGSRTFFDVVQDLIKSDSLIINPVVGPEAITGSSRMKGGSATKIILEAAVLAALDTQTFPDPIDTEPQSLILYKGIIVKYGNAIESFYNSEDNRNILERLIIEAHKSLVAGNSVIYLGANVPGILGLVDASECVPTYGSTERDIRGYLSGGYTALGNKAGTLRTVRDISLKSYLEAQIATSKDTVIVLNDVADLCDAQIKSNTLTIGIDSKGVIQLAEGSPRILNVDQEQITLIDSLIKELLVKLTCNCVSTLSHVLLGKVVFNIMVDVKVSNHKLYHRAISIVQDMGGCDEQKAAEALLTTVYHLCDKAKPSDYTQADLDEVNSLACNMDQVVPASIVMVLANCSIEEARILLGKERRVRTAVKNLLRT